MFLNRKNKNNILFLLSTFIVHLPVESTTQRLVYSIEIGGEETARNGSWFCFRLVLMGVFGEGLLNKTSERMALS